MVGSIVWIAAIRILKRTPPPHSQPLHFPPPSHCTSPPPPAQNSPPPIPSHCTSPPLPVFWKHLVKKGVISSNNLGHHRKLQPKMSEVWRGNCGILYQKNIIIAKTIGGPCIFFWPRCLLSTQHVRDVVKHFCNVSSFNISSCNVSSCNVSFL